MKIFDQNQQVILDKSFSLDMLDLEHVQIDGDATKIPISDTYIIDLCNNIAYTLADSHGWIDTDIGKNKISLIVKLKGNATIQIESFPYYPDDLNDVLNGYDYIDERKSMEDYYDGIKDLKHSEYDYVRVEFEDCEIEEICKVLE